MQKSLLDMTLECDLKKCFLGRLDNVAIEHIEANNLSL